MMHAPSAFITLPDRMMLRNNDYDAICLKPGR